VLSVGLFVFAPARAGAADRKPNFLVILCDDTGWAEFGFQGNKEIPTPHIDSIARNGVRFTQGYVSGPYCSPTRAGLMTGRYQTRFGHEFNSVARQGGLPDAEQTIAQRLKPLGYTTIAVGKWHLGNNPEYRPMKKGFDEFYGTLANTPFYHPTQFVDTREGPDVRKVEDNAFYTTEKYGDRVAEFLDKQGGDKPWFVYLPFNAQHAPLQAPKAYLERFPDIQDPNRRTFAAMMSCMDDAVGKVLAKVREKGQEENTLIVFLSDNGWMQGEHRVTGDKFLPYEESLRIPLIMRGPGVPAGRTVRGQVANIDLAPTLVDVANARAGRKMDGVSLLPTLRDPRKRPQRAIQLEALEPLFRDPVPVNQWDRPYRGVRTDRYTYVVWTETGEKELYDRRKDPHQLSNVAGASAYARVEARLARKLRQLNGCKGAACNVKP
jgi:arylsulfatase A-like enzyme